MCALENFYCSHVKTLENYKRSHLQKPKEEQQWTSSTLVVTPPPTDKVTHVSFHSSKPIMDDAPIQENAKEHPSDMIDGPEEKL